MSCLDSLQDEPVMMTDDGAPGCGIHRSCDEHSKRGDQFHTLTTAMGLQAYEVH